MKLSEIAERLKRECPGQTACVELTAWAYDDGRTRTEISIYVKGLPLFRDATDLDDAFREMRCAIAREERKKAGSVDADIEIDVVDSAQAPTTEDGQDAPGPGAGESNVES